MYSRDVLNLTINSGYQNRNSQDVNIEYIYILFVKSKCRLHILKNCQYLF